MLELTKEPNAPVKSGFVYHLDGAEVQDVIRILAIDGERVRYEHLEWTLEDGWEPCTVVRDDDRRSFVKRLRNGHRLVPCPVTADLVDVVFRNA